MSTVLITGCSSGFGDLTARELARRGHTVFATMRDIEGKNAAAAARLRSGAEAMGGDLHVLELDVTDGASVDRAVAEAQEKAGGALDAVINNAGQMFIGLAEAFSPEELSRQLDVNLVGPHRVIRAALPAMRKRGEGLVVNVTSIAGRIVAPTGGVYHASKFGLEALTEALRYEVSPFGVEVVMVEPGPFGTNLFPSAPAPADQDRVASYGSEGQRIADGFAAAFEAVFQDPDAPTDPKDVVEVLVELVEATAGQRPARTVVGVDFGVRELNRATEPFRQAVLEGIGMPDLDRLPARA